MNNIKNMVDLSNMSIGVAVVLFIIVVTISKHTLETEDKQDWYPTIYAVVLGIIASFISLVVFKYAINNSGCDILTDPFCSKLNVV